MRRIYKLITISFFIAISCTGYCQNESLIKEKIEGRVIDTLEINENNVVIHTIWLNDTLRVKIQDQELTFDFEKMNKAFSGNTSLNTEKGRQEFMQFMKTSGQNCYSYALERYFDSNGFGNQRVFNKKTFIGVKTIHQIVDHYFDEIMTFNTHPKRNLKTKLPDNVLLAFIDPLDSISHTIYYSDGVFYTKNGKFKATKFTNLKKYLKECYTDTKMIKVYRFDKLKLNLSLHP
ncbi:hypothetical protein [Ancylomarina sp.]|uniref:hypothetical protein n=1 Tax=Ancylomarina sp. TaxID=1970196 RepID=UPI0035625AFD